MVAPTGSQVHSTDPRPVPNTGNAYTYEIRDTRIRLYRSGEQVAEIPRPLSRYQRSVGMLYRVEWEHRALTLPARAVDSGEAWADRVGIYLHKTHRPAAAAAFIAAAADLPMTGISPGITEGIPPMAPPLGPPGGTDQADGTRAWFEIGGRLGPLGRLTVGAAVAAPWIEEAGAQTALWHLPGKTGHGKSAVVEVAAAFYGRYNSRRGRSLLSEFDSSGLGLPALAQSYAWLPMMLDEIQNITAPPEPIFTRLIRGAQRVRATRDGDVAENTGRWGGLAISTANDPLRPELRHEMWGRRLIEVTDYANLWGPRPVEADALDEWWNETYRIMRRLEGWGWAAISKQYRPGTEHARTFLRRIQGIPLPAADNIGKVLRLAYAACVWLAEWTGNPAWSEGVWEACLAVGAEMAGAAVDPARETADAIIQHRARMPKEWSQYATDRVAYPSEYGSCDLPHDGKCEGHGEGCGILHPGKCSWWDMPSSIFRAQFATRDTARIARTMFRLALYDPYRGRLAREVRLADEHGKRTKTMVITFCLHALAELASPPALGPALLPTTPEPAPPTLEFSAEASRAETEFPQVTAEAGGGVEGSEIEHQEQPGPVPVYAATTEPDLAAALETAAAEGITDLTGPARPWRDVRVVDAAGWDRHGWAGMSNAGGIVERSGVRIRIRRATDPAAHAAAVEDYAAVTGRHLGASAAAESVRLLRDLAEELHAADQARPGRGSRMPRFILPDDLAAEWRTSLATPRGWTVEGGQPATAAGWDRVRSYLPAITQARLAPLWVGEEYAEVTGSEIPAVTGTGADPAGMWLVSVPVWPWPHLPAPLGTIEAGKEVWTTTEIMRLYAARGVAVHVHRAHLAPAHRITVLDRWSETVRGWLADAEQRPALPIVKGLYQALAGRMMYDPAQYGRAAGRGDVARLDWGCAIGDNSWTSTLRRVYAAADQGWHPVAVHTDAVYYDRPGTPPGFPVGDRPGNFVLETPYSGADGEELHAAEHDQEQPAEVTA